MAIMGKIYPTLPPVVRGQEVLPIVGLHWRSGDEVAEKLIQRLWYDKSMKDMVVSEMLDHSAANKRSRTHG